MCPRNRVQPESRCAPKHTAPPCPRRSTGCAPASRRPPAVKAYSCCPALNCSTATGTARSASLPPASGLSASPAPPPALPTPCFRAFPAFVFRAFQGNAAPNPISQWLAADRGSLLQSPGVLGAFGFGFRAGGHPQGHEGRPEQYISSVPGFLLDSRFTRKCCCSVQSPVFLRERLVA